MICPHCQLELADHVLARHVNKRRCRSRQEAKLVIARGLHPVELRYQNKSDHAAEALRLFGHHAELHNTGHGAGSGMRVWTTEEGAALALIIEEVARLLATSYPEAARRLVAHPDLVGAFGTAWRLGDSKDEETLREILKPIGCRS